MQIFMVLLFVAAHLCAAALVPRITRSLVTVPSSGPSLAAQRRLKRTLVQ